MTDPQEVLNYLNSIRTGVLPVPDPSALRREAAALLAEAERLERRRRDDFYEGTVITFTKPGRYLRIHEDDYVGRLKYAAIKAGNKERCWFLTGIERYGKTWDQLLDFIGEENFHTARSVGPESTQYNTVFR